MKRLLLPMLIILALLTACSANNTAKPSESTSPGFQLSPCPIPSDIDWDMSDMTVLAQTYCISLDALINEDEALNANIKYIAINTDTLKDATQEDKAAVKMYFEKYGLEVIDESFESLKAKGMVKEGNSLEGILLDVRKLYYNIDGDAEVECSKFRSGLGAIGMKCIVDLKEPVCKLKKSQMLWIS